MAMYRKENAIIQEENKLKAAELVAAGYEKVTEEDLKKEAEAANNKRKKKEDPKKENK